MLAEPVGGRRFSGCFYISRYDHRLCYRLWQSVMKSVEWKVFLYTSVGVLLVFSNMTTMDVALPTIVRYFDASPSQANWILLSYMLINTVMILAFGRLADIFGRKALYLFGMALFTLGSLGCGLSWSADALIFFRVVQAIGAASIATNTTALLVDAYPAHQMSLILGLNVSVAAGASIFGPLIGGATVSFLGWRALFLAGVPLALASAIGGVRLLKLKPTRSHERFDVVGAILSFITLGSLIVGLSEGGTLGWTNPIIVACFVSTVVAAFFFVRVQLRTAHPLVDLSILKNIDLVLAYYANLMVAITQIATLLLISLFLQAFLGMDALAAGVHITPLAAGLMVGTLLASRLIGAIEPRRVAAVGMGLVAIGSLVISVQFVGTLNVHIESVLMTMLATIGFGVGLFMTPNTTSIMTSVPPERRGIANGVRSMMQNMGFVVGTALGLAVITSPLSDIAKQAVYAGQSHLLAPDQRTLLLSRYVLMFGLLAGFAGSAVIACLMRRTPSKVAAPDARMG